MKIIGSAEIDMSVGKAFLRIQNEAFEWLNRRFMKGELAEFNILLNYTPILMSPRFIGDYPARSRRSIKENTIFCSPQLDYDRYIAGSAEERRRVFYDGLADALGFMKKFGASDAQLKEFKLLIDDAGA